MEKKLDCSSSSLFQESIREYLAICGGYKKTLKSFVKEANLSDPPEFVYSKLPLERVLEKVNEERRQREQTDKKGKKAQKRDGPSSSSVMQTDKKRKKRQKRDGPSSSSGPRS